jgi:hypothetical protein
MLKKFLKNYAKLLRTCHVFPAGEMYHSLLQVIGESAVASWVLGLACVVAMSLTSTM